MKSIVFACCFCAMANVALAQQYQFVDQFAATGASGQIYVSSMALGASGNIWMAGIFSQTMDADPGIGTTTLQSAGLDLFILKLDPNGQLLWSGTMSGPSLEDIVGMHEDGQGNVYLTGHFQDSLDLDPGAGIDMAISAGNDDFFLVSLSSNGQYRWGHHLGASGFDASGGIAGDAQGNTVITGHFADSVDFDPGLGQYILVGQGTMDAYVAKYDESGALVWADAFSGPGAEGGAGITLDPWGNVFFTGFLTEIVDFDPSLGGNYYLSSSASGSTNGDLFVCKLSPSGGLIWVKGIGNGNDPIGEIGYEIKTDVFGNCYSSGDFDGMVDFDPSALGVFNLNSPTALGTYLMKLDSAGNFVFALQFLGSSSQRIRSIDINANREIFVAGSFQGTMDFDPGFGTYIQTGTGNSTGFVLHLDESGIFYGGYPISGDFVSVDAIAVDLIARSYVAGSFSTSVDFDPSAAIDGLTTASNCRDAFLLGGLEIAIGIPADAIEPKFRVFPNPAQDILTIELPQTSMDANCTVEIYDATGRSVAKKAVSNLAVVTMDVRDLAAGLYTIKISDGILHESGKFVKY